MTHSTSLKFGFYTGFMEHYDMGDKGDENLWWNELITN